MDQPPSPAGPRPIEIAPSVLPADFARLGDEVLALEKAGVDRIQWDVMDGRFVPNLTFGPDVIAACRPHATVPFEAHLMVEEPDALMPRYVDAGGLEGGDLVAELGEVGGEDGRGDLDRPGHEAEGRCTRSLTR